MPIDITLTVSQARKVRESLKGSCDDVAELIGAELEALKPTAPWREVIDTGTGRSYDRETLSCGHSLWFGGDGSSYRKAKKRRCKECDPT